MEAMALERLLGLQAIRTDLNLSYVPLPNTSELVLTADLPPQRLTPTAFLLPYLDDGSLVMATNRRRGVEIPGGHVEPGETLSEAAAREALEEAGCEVRDIRPIGFQRLVSQGTAPEGHRYPFPVSFQQYFAARIVRKHGIADNDEVLQPTVVPDHMSEAVMNGIQLALHRHARELLFPPAAPCP